MKSPVRKLISSRLNESTASKSNAKNYLALVAEITAGHLASNLLVSNFKETFRNVTINGTLNLT